MTEADYSIEEWRPVVGAEGAYEVSSHGRVRSLPGQRRRGIILTPGYHHGYPLVNITSFKVMSRPVHILVCIAFHGPRPDGKEVLHIDGDRANARADNLRWGTRSENVLDAYRHGTTPHHGETSNFAKLTQAKVDAIRHDVSGGMSFRHAATKYGVCKESIKNIITRKTWFRT